jgi:hypothetical protein
MNAAAKPPSTIADIYSEARSLLAAAEPQVWLTRMHLRRCDERYAGSREIAESVFGVQCAAVVNGGAEIVSESNLFADDLHREFRYAVSRIIGERAWRASCGLTTEAASSTIGSVSTATSAAITALTDRRFPVAVDGWPSALFASDAAHPAVLDALRSAADGVQGTPSLQVLHSLVPNADFPELAALCTAINPSCQSSVQRLLSAIFGHQPLIEDMERIPITAQIVASLDKDAKVQFAQNICRAARAGRSALALELALWR